MSKGFFVTGTDTEIGKTVASAWCVQHLDADYWKPVQSGTNTDHDAREITTLLNRPTDRMHPCAYELTEPLSPHAAAAIDGVEIDMATIQVPVTDRPLIIEGAGGVMVPLNDRDLMIDLIKQTGFPAIIVARSTLGTINHTLLTLEALRKRDIAVAGVILSGPINNGNRQAIETYGDVKVLVEIPRLDEVSPASLAAVRPHVPLENLL